MTDWAIAERRSHQWENLIVPDLLDPFSETPPDPHPHRPMTQSQRQTIRSLFEALGVRRATDQFQMVQVLTGVTLSAVTDLDSKGAALLTERLRRRVEGRRVTTGNSWIDRDEDTWIDKM
ncbi:hypothetical protein [Microbacterium galbinum]|uniref:hypothetical protein n=1 Tax=Microbacterium galbinum TaxID=2851646 RepID=UPI001FFC4763|nr:hypothetical protein [Microbacterium galbinum]MCK2029894.1 hypothetical protein [Microbacterium galbinum]